MTLKIYAVVLELVRKLSPYLPALPPGLLQCKLLIADQRKRDRLPQRELRLLSQRLSADAGNADAALDERFERGLEAATLSGAAGCAGNIVPTGSWIDGGITPRYAGRGIEMEHRTLRTERSQVELTAR
ncbi:MAG TPA: hypothetical protein VFS67_18545 [Polyangiaceae bacterium]|nr:hypothetical protein [Polyangiaceae bacterium]